MKQRVAALTEEKRDIAGKEPDIAPRKSSVAIFVFITLSCMVLLLGSALFSKPPSSGVTWDRAGYAPETPVTIQLPDGSIFDVPAAYMWVWPSTSNFGKVNYFDNFSFNFWMPEKRFLEVNPMNSSGVGPRPQEKGRPAPEPYQYVVGIDDFSIGWPLGLTPIQTQIKNRVYLSSSSINGNPPFLTGERRNIYGLVELVTQEDYSSRLFIADDNSNIEVFFDCERKGIFNNTLCKSHVYVNSKNYYFYLYLPGDQISQWHNVIDAAIELADKWKR